MHYRIFLLLNLISCSVCLGANQKPLTMEERLARLIKELTPFLDNERRILEGDKTFVYPLEMRTLACVHNLLDKAQDILSVANAFRESDRFKEAYDHLKDTSHIKNITFEKEIEAATLYIEFLKRKELRKSTPSPVITISLPDVPIPSLTSSSTTTTILACAAAPLDPLQIPSLDETTDSDNHDDDGEFETLVYDRKKK